MRNFISGKKRYTIALQVIQMDYGYGSMLWQGAADAAEKRDVNLILFPGHALNTPRKFERQNNIIYQFINNNNVDAFIMISTLLANFIQKDDFKKFYKIFGSLPVINIGERIQGIPSIIIDNKTGIRDLVGHLSNVHRFRRIAFVKGLEGNFDSSERFQAYREALDENHLPFDPSLVASGNFTRACAQDSIQELFGKKHGKIDAIMFSNDEMAISSMRYLKDQGYYIPGDFAITGFDNIEEIEFETPPLTTIRQPLYELTKKAVELAIEIIEGKTVPELIIFPTSTIIRASCGCLSKTVNQIRLINDQTPNKEEISAGNSGWPSNDSVVMEIKSLPDIGPDMPESFFQNIRKAYSGFLDYADKCLANGDNSECSIQYLKILSQILFNEIQNGRDVSIWYLIVMRISVILTANKPELKPSALMLQISVMIGEMHKLNQGYIRIRYFWQFMTLRDITYGMLSNQDMEELLNYLVSQLPRLGINTCILTIYEREWQHGSGDVWEMPCWHYVRLYFDKKGKREIRGLISRPFSTSRLLPDRIFDDKKRYSFIVMPLISRQTHFGNIFFEIGPREGFIYESLVSQISVIYKSILLFKKREIDENNLKIALSDLEQYNIQLKELSITDELTGLYNRRGFLSLAGNNLALARRIGKQGIIVFADLNGLKTINDTYGYEAGDWAIKQISMILIKTFRETDIIARLGGDEFSVFMVGSTMAQIGIYQKRIEKLLVESNSNSRKPFNLSISIGSIPFQADENTAIEDLLKEADKILCNQKRKRKERLKSKQ